MSFSVNARRKVYVEFEKNSLKKNPINIDITDAEDRFQASLLCTMMTRKEHLRWQGALPILEIEISREIYRILILRSECCRSIIADF
jgi:hypothetical protein